MICRDFAGTTTLRWLAIKEHEAMGEAIGLGRKRPDGEKIVELRKQLGLKQEALANRVSISVRLLRDIEKKNHPVPSTTITAIATELKVSPDRITVPDQDGSEQDQMLKLKRVRSATELAHVGGEVQEYWWDVRVDPTAATAKEMQQLLRIIRRLVDRSSKITDEFDDQDATGPTADPPEDYGYIARLARLQEAIDTLWANGVGVLAASYYKNVVTDKDDESLRGPKVRVPTGKIWICTGKLEIRFVPRDVEEIEIPADTGVPLDQVESLLGIEEESAEKTKGTDHDEHKT